MSRTLTAFQAGSDKELTFIMNDDCTLAVDQLFYGTIYVVKNDRPVFWATNIVEFHVTD